MTRRHFLVLFLLAAFGYVALAALAPRLNPSLRWGYSLDREAAVTRARECARSRGLDASRWEAYVTADRNRRTDYYLSRHARRPELRLLSPIITSVRLIEPGGERRSFKVNLTPDNQVRGFVHHTSAKSTEQPASIEQARQQAGAALDELVGSDAARFSLVSEADQGAEGVRFTWERAIPDEPALKLEATSLVRGGSVSELEVTPNFSKDFDEEFRVNRNADNPEELLTALLVMVATLALVAFYLLSLSRGEIDHRSALVLFAAVFLLCLFVNFCSSGADESIVKEASDAGSQWGRRAKLILEPLGEAFFYALGLALVWSVGLALARRRDALRMASLAGLLKGHLLSKPIAWRVAVGLLLGGLVSAVPYLVAASNLFQGMEAGETNPELFVASAPAVASFSLPVGYMLPLLYGFLVPLLSRGIRATRLVRLAGVAVGWIWLIDSGLYESSALGAVCVAGLTIAILDEIYWRYDLLALCTALLASSAATAAWSLLVQPSASLRQSGGRALVGLGVLLVVALVVSLEGRAARLEDELPTLPVDTARSQRAERERLVAEFDVARQAQQRMLPASPPQIPGYEIAASCRPAREVGGDLYDFLTLPDERIGIVVADVSGKGVPAALYMTLTKGLLASIAENESDPSSILREVNRHLYAVCGRKMFVTMILGVLDPATGTLTYARAGHNPGVWRCIQSQTDTLLRAPGLGLGLNKGKLFDRALRPETIQVKPGDALLFYSDGITEAMNGAREEYGEERLLAAVAAADGLSAAQTQDAVLTDVNQFLDGTPPQDDMTLVVVRVKH